MSANDRQAAREEWIAEELLACEVAKLGAEQERATTIDRAVRVLARPGDPRDPLEALFALPSALRQIEV